MENINLISEDVKSVVKAENKLFKQLAETTCCADQDEGEINNYF